MKDITKIKLLSALGELTDRNFTLKKLCGNVDIEGENFNIERKLPIKNQGDTMMCVGYSHAAVIENLLELDKEVSQYMIYHNRDLNKFEEFPFPGWYNNLAEKHLANEGVCYLQDYNNNKEAPDGIFDFMKVKDDILNNKKIFKILNYYELNNIEEAKQFVAAFKDRTNIRAGIILSIAIYNNFANISKDGIFPYPEGDICGYHSIAVSAIDDKYIKVQNSVGNDWGDNGYGYIPIDAKGIIQEISGITISFDESSKPSIPEPVKALFRVQIGAYRNKENAIAVQAELAKKKLTYEQKKKIGSNSDYIGSCLIYENGYFKVQAGSFAVYENANNLKIVLKELGYDAFIKKYIKK